MLELGAYWGHYSLWLHKQCSHAFTYLVEPDPDNLSVGQYNFELNKRLGGAEFIDDFVGDGHFVVDRFVKDKKLVKLDILHSDIQGCELEMVTGCARSLEDRIIDYCFISTHSQDLHSKVESRLRRAGYRIEVSSDVDHHTTSGDGFLFASSPSIPCIFSDFKPLGREDICHARPQQLVASVREMASRSGAPR